MPEAETKSEGSCVGFILTVLVLWSLVFGLPTPWGILDIDIFPPRINLSI